MDRKACLVERVFSLTQLREMPFAERSAEMTKENECSRAGLPQLRQRDDVAGDVQDFGVWRRVSYAGWISYARLIHTDFVWVYASME
jgi:hypothetical protein